MAIGFKVQPNVVALGHVVQVLHASGGTDYGHFLHVGNVAGGGAIGVRGLDDPELFFLRVCNLRGGHKQN